MEFYQSLTSGEKASHSPTAITGIFKRGKKTNVGEILAYVHHETKTRLFIIALSVIITDKQTKTLETTQCPLKREWLNVL